MTNYVIPSVMDAHSSKCGCGPCSQGLRGLGAIDVSSLISGPLGLIISGLKMANIDIIGMLTNVTYSSDELNQIRAFAKPGTDPEALVAHYKDVVSQNIQGAIPGLTNAITRNPNPANVVSHINGSIAAAKGVAKADAQAFAGSMPSSGGGSGSHFALTQNEILGGAAIGLLGLLLYMKSKKKA